jgi:hypothetical protein
MRHQLRFAVTLAAASVALTACNSDEPVSAPTIGRAVRVNADVLPACDFNNKLKPDVRSYVASGSDPIYDIIRSMQGATTTDAVYTFGMQGLARLAEVRSSLNPVLKRAGATAAQGGAAVTDFLACMPVGPVQGNFATNIVKAMDIGGMFEVPLASSTEFVVSRGKSPFWVTVPLAGTWGDLIGKRVMIFGYEIGNIPGNLDPILGPSGFDFNSVPMLAPGATFANDVLIGACGIAAGNNARIKHVNSIGALETFECPPPQSLASLSANDGLNFASLARRTLSLFAPQPLSAATTFSGGVGNGAIDYSPAAVVTVNVTLSFASQPVGGPISETLKGTDGISVKVLVKTAAPGNSPLEHAFVKLEVTGNSGRDAVFFDPTLPSPSTSAFVTRETGVNGIADFGGVRLLKAGGYVLTATVDFDNIQGTPVLSNNGVVFNMTNK